MDQALLQIKDFYERAWKSIVEKDFKTATRILYNEMSMKLYDSSVNIEYLKIDKANATTTKEAQLLIFKEELQHLIMKVQKALAEESGYTDEEAINGEDLTEEEEIKDPEDEEEDDVISKEDIATIPERFNPEY